MKIRDLEPGQRFRYEFGKTATLVRLGAMGARIKYEGRERQVAFQAKSGDEVVADVAFVAPSGEVIVSDYSDVEVIP